MSRGRGGARDELVGEGLPGEGRRGGGRRQRAVVAEGCGEWQAHVGDGGRRVWGMGADLTRCEVEWGLGVGGPACG
jgi:hypothetical protein